MARLASTRALVSEPEAGSLNFRPPGNLDPAERLQCRSQLFLVHADTSVGDRQQELSGLDRLSGDNHLAARR